MARRPRRTGSKCGTKHTGKPSACAISGACWCVPTRYGDDVLEHEACVRARLQLAACTRDAGLRVDDDVRRGRSRRRAARARGSPPSRSSRGSRSAGRPAATARESRSSRRRAADARSRTTAGRAPRRGGARRRDRRRRRRPAARTRPPARCRDRAGSRSAPEAAASSFGTKAGSEPFRRTSSAEADEPASESEPSATTSSSGWRSARSRVSCPA